MKKLSIPLLAFLTATASALYIVENLLMSALPVPFLRIGLANVVMLYLVYNRYILAAFVVTIAKSVIGGIATFNLLSPTLPLSLGGGIAAVIVMSLGLLVRPRFSIFGISILGALAHNGMQLCLARLLIIRSPSLFVLTPILIFLALFSGVITAYLCIYIEEKYIAQKAEI
ncbi:MAG: Gx transporter family protein [Candidatus Cloacimonetes bacterium]|nr:Gx transporter family protein [Candidatus Cloacimonadota bacterium]